MVQARNALNKRSLTEECGDLVRIARYLLDAVTNDEITLAEAELAIVEWTHDPDLLRTAANAPGPDEGAGWLLQRVSGRCRWAA